MMARNKRQNDAPRETTPDEKKASDDRFEEEVHESSPEETPDRGEHDVEDELDRLRRELEEVEGRYKRALADYSNFQRRARQNEMEARQAGVRSVLESLIPALDSFEMALSQDLSGAKSVEDVVSGVRAIQEGLLTALAGHGVTVVRPEVGEDFDPSRHEAVAHTRAEGVEPGNVSAVLQIGFAIGERVVRPAKVAVAPDEEG